MSSTSNISTRRSILQQRCPRCRSGKIFRESILRIFRLRWPRMHERCPVCDLKFEREPGYFLGAMYISYGVSLVTILLLAVAVWATTGWGIMKDTFWAMGLFVPLAPAITLFARVLWMYLDWKIDPGSPRN